MDITIDDTQRAEILVALIDRKAAIAKHVKDLTKDSMPDAAAVAEKRLALYSTQTGAGGKVGLVAMFSLAPDLDEEHVKAGETRDPEGQQDIFGGGAETGGGHPAGAVEYVGAFGKLYPTQAAADASFREGPESSDAPSGDAAGFKALPSGEPAEDAHEVEIGAPEDSPETTLLDGDSDAALADAEESSPGSDEWDQGTGAHREPAE